MSSHRRQIEQLYPVIGDDRPRLCLTARLAGQRAGLSLGEWEARPIGEQPAHVRFTRRRARLAGADLDALDLEGWPA